MIQKTRDLPIALNAPLRFTELDAMQAAEEWGFNCGPAALCAMLGLTPAELRPHMLDFEAKGYTNPTLMNDVLDRLGIRYRLTWRSDKGEGERSPGDVFTCCKYALVRVQWAGPWTKPGVPMRARYRQTHWIGCKREPALRGGSLRISVFDVNEMERGGWVPLTHWFVRTIPMILRICVPHADGDYWPTHALEINL